MKKIGTFFSFALLFICLLSLKAYAGNVTLNKSKLSDGVLGIKYSGGFSKSIKITVEKDSERYIYSIKNNDLCYVPLQLGKGTYKVSVLENVSGDKYKPILAENVNLDVNAGVKMYTYPTFETYFNDSMSSIKYYENKIKGKDSGDKVTSVYNDVVNNYSYDYPKADKLPSDYLPYIDDMFSSKKGICYDYAALMAGILRDQGIPTKLVKGYAPNIKVYHAWNEIYVGGKWMVVDTTYDAAMVQAGKKVDIAKNADEFKVLKFY